MDSRSLAAAIWDAARAGLTGEEIAASLAARSALPLAQVQADVARVLTTWGSATDALASIWTLRLADRRIALTVADPELAGGLEPLIAHLKTEHEGPAHARLRLAGTPADWQLFVDESLTVTGDTRDAAIARTVAELVEAACAINRRLLVLHAAGVSRAGRGLLLIGPGGAGKTTLAAALNASGWELLSDDVIPVTLGRPTCWASA